MGHAPELRISELLREQAVNAARQEVPHGMYVEIADMEMHAQPQNLWVRAFLIVERESQKGILVGKGGERIRAIVAAAERECAAAFPYPIRLDVRVKARPRWRRNDALLRKLMY